MKCREQAPGALLSTFLGSAQPGFPPPFRHHVRPDPRPAGLSDPELKPATHEKQKIEMQSEGPTLGPSVCPARGQKVAELRKLLVE